MPQLDSPALEAPARGGPTDPVHDERLRRGIIDTAVPRSVAWALTGAFVVAIYAVPLGQAVLERLRDEPSSLSELFTRAPSREHLRAFETGLEEASYAKSFVQPHLQLWLSRFGRAGNRRAVIGRAGWLFYTPGITHLAGPSFLDRDAQRTRESEAQRDDPTSGLRADPMPAIIAFQAMLERRGIRLVLFPVPDKAMLQPRQLHGRGGSATVDVPHNAGFRSFAAALRARGVLVFDPAPLQLSAAERERFLVQDTHWTPEWMEQVARELSQFVRQAVPLPAAEHALHAVPQAASRLGDLVDMLKLPETQTLFRPQTVTVHQMQTADSEPWQPEPSAEVLLLGDSFTNVFTLDGMEWGEAAGLAPQLAAALGLPLDVIAQNDSGAFATRQALWRELARGADRLRGKRVVIWEFASRELSVGDWKLFDWTTREVD